MPGKRVYLEVLKSIKLRYLAILGVFKKGITDGGERELVEKIAACGTWLKAVCRTARAIGGGYLGSSVLPFEF